MTSAHRLIATLNPPSRPCADSWWTELQASTQAALWYARAQAEFARMRESKEAMQVRPITVDAYL